MEKVLICRNMLRYEHMDECGIGTDCICKFYDTGGALLILPENNWGWKL